MPGSSATDGDAAIRGLIVFISLIFLKPSLEEMKDLTGALEAYLHTAIGDPLPQFILYKIESLFGSATPALKKKMLAQLKKFQKANKDSRLQKILNKI